jgi:hypothetical protein
MPANGILHECGTLWSGDMHKRFFTEILPGLTVRDPAVLQFFPGLSLMSLRDQYMMTAIPINFIEVQE